jgi:Protein of unknown function (DUF2637)
MTAQTSTTQTNHRRAVRFFWGLLIGATLVSLIGNITHAVLPYIPHVFVQIGTAAVPPIALLAAVHGIALAVRAGASGRVYWWAVSAVATIGLGAFALSFLALRDLMRAIGYSSTTAWIFPALIDTAVAVSTLMLVALGDKPAGRGRTATASSNTQPPVLQRWVQTLTRPAKGEVAPPMTSARAQRVQAARGSASTSVQPRPARAVQDSAQTGDTEVDVAVAEVDADLAAGLIASGVTTQPAETVIAVLEAHRNGASINAAAKASGINYRTAQRIVQAAAGHRQRPLVAVG